MSFAHCAPLFELLNVVVLVVVGFDLHVFINACFSSFRLHILGHVSLVPFFSLHICTGSRRKEREEREPWRQ